MNESGNRTSSNYVWDLWGNLGQILAMPFEKLVTPVFAIKYGMNSPNCADGYHAFPSSELGRYASSYSYKCIMVNETTVDCERYTLPDWNIQAERRRFERSPFVGKLLYLVVSRQLSCYRRYANIGTDRSRSGLPGGLSPKEPNDT